MDLHNFLQAHRRFVGLGFVTLTPPNPKSLQRPAVRQAIRAVDVNKATPADIEILKQHWMLIEN